MHGMMSLGVLVAAFVGLAAWAGYVSFRLYRACPAPRSARAPGNRAEAGERTEPRAAVPAADAAGQPGAALAHAEDQAAAGEDRPAAGEDASQEQSVYPLS